MELKSIMFIVLADTAVFLGVGVGLSTVVVRYFM